MKLEPSPLADSVERKLPPGLSVPARYSNAGWKPALHEKDRTILNPSRLLRTAGFSLLELTVAMAIVGGLLIIMASLQGRLFSFEQSIRIELMAHPEPTALLSRMRKDVLDADGYPAGVAGYEQSPKTLILGGWNDLGEPIRVVYDFSEDGVARRLTFSSAGGKTTEWTARNVPIFIVTSFELPDESIGVRLKGTNPGGGVLIDQVYEPRRKS